MGREKSLLKNLATSLILYEKIKTTQGKAKAVRSLVERLIKRGKKDDLKTKRYLGRFLPKNAVLKIIENLAPRFKDRESGFTRIIKIGSRKGDGAKMVLMELLEEEESEEKK